MEYSSIFNFCSVTSANLTKVYRMKEIFSSFFSSANIIVRATICGTIELPLQGAWVVFIRYPGRCPGLWRYWAFSPLLFEFLHTLLRAFGLSARFNRTIRKVSERSLFLDVFGCGLQQQKTPAGFM